MAFRKRLNLTTAVLARFGQSEHAAWLITFAIILSLYTGCVFLFIFSKDPFWPKLPDVLVQSLIHALMSLLTVFAASCSSRWSLKLIITNAGVLVFGYALNKIREQYPFDSLIPALIYQVMVLGPWLHLALRIRRLAWSELSSSLLANPRPSRERKQILIRDIILWTIVCAELFAVARTIGLELLASEMVALPNLYRGSASGVIGLVAVYAALGTAGIHKRMICHIGLILGCGLLLALAIGKLNELHAWLVFTAAQGVSVTAALAVIRKHGTQSHGSSTTFTVAIFCGLFHGPDGIGAGLDI
jgi:hypothetical protein